jgi:nucleotidyltransferase DUF2204
MARFVQSMWPMSQAESPLLTTPDKAELYRQALEMLNRSGVPYLVGGTYAFHYYAGIARTTKDFDIFVRGRDLPRVLDVLGRCGFKTEIAFSHWLAKAFNGDRFIDIIFNSGNGIVEVDDEWFAHAVDEEVLGVPVKLCAAEEMIWSKSFIMERERYDGADVAHLLRAQSHRLDWHRLFNRFGDHWRVLLSYIVLFGYIYPAERSKIPEWVQSELAAMFAREIGTDAAGESVCAGTFLSRAQFSVDVAEWGYRDLRTPELMSSEAVERWTAAAVEESTTARLPKQ